MKRTNKYNLIFLMAVMIAGTFLFSADSASANQYCANGTTMTAQEVYVAQTAGKVSSNVIVQNGHPVFRVTNTTGCTAPMIAASYKMFVEYPDAGWLSRQQFYADSGVVNINANGTTDIALSVPDCRSQIDLWNQSAPHSFTSDVDGAYAGYVLVGSIYSQDFLDTYPRNLCTYPVVPAPVVVAPVVAPAPSQTITQTQSNNQNVYVNPPTPVSTYTYQNSNNNNNYNNNNNNNSCVNFSYKQCVGNNIYWYNSCGQQTDLYQTCYGSNACQAGACVTTQPVYPTYPTYPTYTSHYRTACYTNNVYWYDSVGAVNSVYKNCADANSCTTDTCSGSACTNTLKCDGTTCAVTSADYNTYCQNGSNTGNSIMLFSLFAKKDAITTQWDKSVEIRSNETSYFLMTVENNSQENIQTVRVSANIPAEITSLGNLKVNDVSVSGDIVSGIDVGPLAVGVSKRITFEGISGTITLAGTKQVIAKVEYNGISQPDSLSVNFSTASVAGAVTEAKSSIWIVEFLKRWYLWILGMLVLISLFVVIFRRLSSNQ